MLFCCQTEDALVAHLWHGLQARQLLGVEPSEQLCLQLLLLLPLQGTCVHPTAAHLLLLHAGRVHGRQPPRACRPLRGQLLLLLQVAVTQLLDELALRSQQPLRSPKPEHHNTLVSAQNGDSCRSSLDTCS